MAFGRAATNYERASISYYHVGNSNASNSLRFGLFGASGLLNIQADGKSGLGTTSPTSRADINGANGYSQLRLRATYTPTSSADSLGNTGDIAWDANYFYIKTAAGWKRAALSTF